MRRDEISYPVPSDGHDHLSRVVREQEVEERSRAVRTTGGWLYLVFGVLFFALGIWSHFGGGRPLNSTFGAGMIWICMSALAFIEAARFKQGRPRVDFSNIRTLVRASDARDRRDAVLVLGIMGLVLLSVVAIAVLYRLT